MTGLAGMRPMYGPTGILIGLDLEVLGTPAPQGSKKALGRARSGRVIMIESSKRVGPWREAVKAVVVAHTGGSLLFPDGAIELTAVFRFERPKHHFGTGRNAAVIREAAPEYHVIKPDGDKLLRSTMDALIEAGIAKDDCQFVRGSFTKVYAHPAAKAGASLFVRVLMDSQAAVA